MTEAEILLKQIEPIEQLYNEILAGDDQHHSARIHQYYTLCQAFITRVAGSDSVYARSAAKELEKKVGYDHEGCANLPVSVRPLYGIVQALKSDIANGYLSSLRELLHADLFSDFLDMAHHLLQEGYKDPAAVLAGGVLEGHLRQLCAKNSIDLEKPNSRGEIVAKMASEINADCIETVC
jgi:hypothetical protein